MRYKFLLLAAALAFSTPAFAQFDLSGRPVQVEPEPVSMTLEQILPQINQSKVLKSPKYAMSRSMLNRKVRDKGTKLIGEVKDVYVAPGGSVSGVLTQFNRLHLNDAVVLDMAADNVTGVKDGYTVGLTADEIKTVHPQMVVRSAQAAPSGFALKKLVGVDVVSAGGKEFATLKEILFDYKGEHADIGYLVVNFGSLKNRPVAVPFSILEMQEDRGRPVMMVSNENLEVLLKYLTPKAQ